MFRMYPESSYELTEPEDILNYVRGGKGIVTLQSPTGVHRTYAFMLPRHPNEFKDGTMFVYTQTSNNIWMYVGMLNQNNDFRLTCGSHYSYNHPISKGAFYIVKMMTGRIENSPMKLYHAGICSVCGRKLTNPKSIELGIGRKCKKRVFG